MTDYLEELLEEQIGQEETEVALEFPREGGSLWKKSEEVTGADRTEQDPPELVFAKRAEEMVKRPMAEKRQSNPYLVRGRAVTPGEGLSPTFPAPVEWSDATEKARGQGGEELVPAMETGVGILYKRLRKSRGAIAYGKRLMGGDRQVTIAGSEPAGTAAGLGAGELDHIFQRDARRYDGAFLLY